MDSARSSPTQQAARTAADQAGSVATAAAEQTSQVAGTTADQTKQVAQTVQEQAQQVVGTVKEQVADISGEVAGQARNLLEESKTQLHNQAQTQAEQIASTVRQIGDQLQALIEGRVEDAGPVADYARQAADTVSRFANQIEQRGFDGVVEDVQRFARRKPGVFLLGAAAAGFGIARVLRTASGATTPSPSPDGLAGQYYSANTLAATTGIDPLGAGVGTTPPLAELGEGSVTGMSSLDDDQTRTIDTDRLAP